MWDNQCILKYNIDFNRLAIQTGWSDNILWHQYYSRLAKQIKDVMGQQGKPANLPEMKTLVHAIDSHHWEWLHKKFHSNKPAPNKDNKSQQKSEKKPKTSSSNYTKQNSSTSTSSNNNKLVKPSASSTSISDKLGKDSKLSAEEHQRRFDNNLCLYCGGTGHKTADCKKVAASTSKAKACVAAVKEKETTKKRLSSPLASAHPEDCIIPSCAAMEAVCLNASTLSNPKSLCVHLTSTSVPDSVDKHAVVLCVQCTKDIKQNMNIETRLSVTATLGNCRTLFMCDYVFSEHKRLDNINVILLETKEYIDWGQTAFL